LKINIELDTANADDVATLDRLFGVPASEPPAKKPRKPTEPVKGNPDVEAPQHPGQAAAHAAVEAAAAVEAKTVAAVTPVKLKADAPAEIVALQSNPADRDVVGKALLKACKPVAEGGLSREVALSLTEQFRPAGNTEKLVKVGMIPNGQLAALAALVLAEYAK
jgi:hypothetical protein